MTDKSLDDLKSTFNAILDIPNIEVDEVERDREGNYRVTIRSTERGTRCHQCGHFIDHCYGQGEFITLRHLPLFGRQVELRLRAPRYQCQRCQGQPTTTQRATWYDARSRCTKAFEHHILLACVNSTVWDVSIKEGIGYETVRGIIDRHIAKEVDWQAIKNLKIIGIDEISLKKGHQDFVTIVTGRMGGETVILGMLADRKKEPVKDFFMSIPKRLRKQVRFVCSDLYVGFINAAKEVFGKRVQVIVDRFHVAKLYGKGLDELRKKELARLRTAGMAQDMEYPEIENKLMTPEEAVKRYIKNRSQIALGGFTINRNPMGIIYEIIRQRVKDLHIVCHSHGQALDLLIGAGCVKRVEVAYAGNGRFAPTCIRFRKAVENREIEYEDYSNYQMSLRFLAGALGIPFIPTRSGLGTDLVTSHGFPPEIRKERKMASEKLVMMQNHQTRP